MHRVDHARSSVSVLDRAEDHGVRRLESAEQASEGVGLEPAVLGDARGHKGVGDLHEKGPPAAEEEHAFAIDATDDRVGREQAGHTITLRQRLPRPASWHDVAVHLWELVLVPASLIAISFLLAGTAWLEHSVLSPRSIIISGVRVKGGKPENIEQIVAAQAERLLRETGDR